MKAIRIREPGGTDVLEFVEVDSPVPQKDQVIVRTESISVNYADLMIRKGLYPVMPPLPTVLGLEGAGVVEELGDEVSDIRVGQRVSFIAPGSYAEKVAVKSSAIIPIPDEISMDTAAAFPIIYLTAYHMLHTIGKVREGGWILLYAAAGGVGTAVIQLSKIAGLQVVGLTSSQQKAARAKELGIDHVFTYDHPNPVQDLMKVTGGKGFDLILDSVAGPNFERKSNIYLKNTVKLRGPWAPTTKDCSISAVLDGPATKTP